MDNNENTTNYANNTNNDNKSATDLPAEDLTNKDLTNKDPQEVIRDLSQDPALKAAADSGRKLIDLWPLTDSIQLDNDVKYNETLRVRQTREFAQLLVKNFDVTSADADYVYEGAETIPGRPQEIVDALMLANDVYDDVADFSQKKDPAVFGKVIERMGGLYIRKNKEDFEALTKDCDRLMESVAKDKSGSSDLALRLAVSLYAYTRIRQCVASFSADNSARIVSVLYLNEFHERWSLPRLFVRYEYLMIPFMHSQDSWNALSQAAEAEWNKHAEDVLWNPAEAKRLAKEEDEKKSKAALAKKFEHVTDDPNKPHVEL